MAVTPLTVTSQNRSAQTNLAAAGTAVPGATADRHSFPNDGNTTLQVINTNAGACTVTVYFQGAEAPNFDGVTLTGTLGRIYSVPATTGNSLLGPFPVNLYGANVIVGYSTTTGTTVRVLQPTN